MTNPSPFLSSVEGEDMTRSQSQPVAMTSVASSLSSAGSEPAASLDDLRELQRLAGIPHLPTQLTYEARLAISGRGPRAYDWSDKPHRLVYDLCRHIEALSAPPATPWMAIEGEPEDEGTLAHAWQIVHWHPDMPSWAYDHLWDDDWGDGERLRDFFRMVFAAAMTAQAASPADRLVKPREDEKTDPQTEAEPSAEVKP